MQNKEPSHFLSLFKGKMVVRSGEPTSGKSSFGAESRLFHIRGTNAIDTRAVEVAPTATSLNSADCFILQAEGGKVFAWEGAGSNADERATASTLAKNVLASNGESVVEVKEGSEPEEFWTALGGKAEYANEKHLQASVQEPRLFSVSGVTGNFKVEELHNFSQDDLSQDGVFLLDTVAEVYVWLGNNARAADKEAAYAMALSYVTQAPDGRSASTPVFRVVASAEPPTFTAQFRGWSFERAQDFSDPYAKKLAALKGESPASSSSAPASNVKPSALKSPTAAAAAPAAAKVAPAAAAPAAASSGAVPAAGQHYTLAELKAGVPAGVDPVSCYTAHAEAVSVASSLFRF